MVIANFAYNSVKAVQKAGKIRQLKRLIQKSLRKVSKIL